MVANIITLIKMQRIISLYIIDYTIISRSMKDFSAPFLHNFRKILHISNLGFIGLL